MEFGGVGWIQSNGTGHDLGEAGLGEPPLKVLTRNDSPSSLENGSDPVAEPLPIFRQARRRNDSVGKTGTVWRILSQDEARVRSGPIEDPWVEAHS